MRSWPLMACLFLPVSAGAQASPYIPLDDPHLPAFELLVARGEVRDPSPMVRPFRTADALAALTAADTAGGPGRRIIQELRAAWVQDTSPDFWSLEGRAGLDAFTEARRNPAPGIGPDTPGGVAFYGEVRAEARTGPMIVVSRPAIEPRVEDDPGWYGRDSLKVTGRMAEAYVGGQWKHGRFYFGTMDHQWGPRGIDGIPLSANAYPRTEFGFRIGNKVWALEAISAALTDDIDTLNVRTHRYWFTHRLSLRPSDRLMVALWETTVYGGVDRQPEARWSNPASFLLLSNIYGIGADGNLMIGSDLSWWMTPKLNVEAQLAIDDLNYPDPGGTDHTPTRYAFTVAASGPARWGWAWKVLYSQASSLAFRSFRPEDRYADIDVGLGRATASNDQLSLLLTVPATPAWILTPELTMHRQGEMSFDDPFPEDSAVAGQVPVLFLGTVETTWRAAVGISGARGALRATGSVGVDYVRNADHVQDRSEVTPVARLRVTLGLGTGGNFQ